MPIVVVLGTGTEVGKTYATVTLAKILSGRLSSATVVALKPIESGLSISAETDAALLASASSPPIESGHAYALKAPVSPHLAARLDNQYITTESVLQWTLSRNPALQEEHRSLSVNNSWTLIETAGGALSPINTTQTNVSLAQAFEPAIWVLVAPNRLGVLHDLRATLIAIGAIARTPDIILLNASATSDASTATNRHEIEALKIAQVTGEIVRNGGMVASDESRLLTKLIHCTDRYRRSNIT